MTHPHPLDPLSPAELKLAVEIINESEGATVYYKALNLLPPPKKILTVWLDDSLAGKSVAPLARKVRPVFPVDVAPGFAPGFAPGWSDVALDRRTLD